MLGEHVDVTQGTFQEHSIEDRSTIHAVLITRIETREQVQNLVDEVIACNLGTVQDRLTSGATVDEHGKLKDW